MTTLDGLKLGRKFLILFLVCVLLPLITTNGFILWSMKKGMDKEQNQRVEGIGERLKLEFANDISEQLSIADYLDRNVNLQEFLKTEYEDASDYYEDMWN